MRPLKITPRNTDHLHLENVSEEFKFVELNFQAINYYLIGVGTAEKLKLESSEKYYDTFVAWHVYQAIKRAKFAR